MSCITFLPFTSCPFSGAVLSLLREPMARNDPPFFAFLVGGLGLAKSYDLPTFLQKLNPFGKDYQLTQVWKGVKRSKLLCFLEVPLMANESLFGLIGLKGFDRTSITIHKSLEDNVVFRKPCPKSLWLGHNSFRL